MTPREQRLTELAQEIEDRLHEAEVLLLGTEVSYLGGRYKGRLGTISAIHFEAGKPWSAHDKGPSFSALALVDRVDGSGTLNSDAQSRQYWPLRSLDGWR